MYLSCTPWLTRLSCWSYQSNLNPWFSEGNSGRCRSWSEHIPVRCGALAVLLYSAGSQLQLCLTHQLQPPPPSSQKLLTGKCRPLLCIVGKIIKAFKKKVQLIFNCTIQYVTGSESLYFALRVKVVSESLIQYFRVRVRGGQTNGQFVWLMEGRTNRRSDQCHADM